MLHAPVHGALFRGTEQERGYKGERKRRVTFAEERRALLQSRLYVDVDLISTFDEHHLTLVVFFSLSFYFMNEKRIILSLIIEKKISCT